MFLLPFSNRSRLPEGDVTKNRTSSSETIKFTLATRAGYPFSNTQSHQQYQQKPRYPHQNSSPNPNLSYPSQNIPKRNNYNNNNNNNNQHHDSNKLKHDPDNSHTYTLTTGFRYNNNNNNFDQTNFNRTHKTHNEHDTTNRYRQQSVAIKTPTTTTTESIIRINDQNRDDLDLNQRNQKYLDFIVSDIQPQSFQTSSKTRTTSTKPLSPSEKELVNAFVNSQSSIFIQSTPKSHVLTTLPNKNTESQPITAIHIPSSRLPQQNDTYRFSLTNGVSNKRNPKNRTIVTDYEQSADYNYHHASHAESENIPLYVRNPQSTNSIGHSANSISTLKHEIIIPTTYSPLRNWKIQYLKKPVLPGSEVFNSVVDAVAPEDMKKAILGPQNNRTNSKSHPSSVPSIQRDVVSPTSKTVSKFSFTFDGEKDYDRPKKTTTRQPTKFPSYEFKERLNRTFDTTSSKPLISPYASLQTILEDVKPTQYRPSLGSYSITFGKNNIHTSSTTTTTTTRAPPTTTKAPVPPPSTYFQSYFIITAPPKNKTQNTPNNYQHSSPNNYQHSSSNNYQQSSNYQPTSHYQPTTDYHPTSNYQTTSNYQPSSTANPHNSYTPFSSSSTTPISITTPVSITTDYPTVSSTQKPYDWTPISSSVFPNNVVNNVQINPQDERFRPIRPTDRPIDITEKPIISITTSFPQKVNYENYIQQSSISNLLSNENFPPYQTTTPISITTSTPQFSQFPPQEITQASHGRPPHRIPPHGFSQIPSFNRPQQGREHYRKVVRMRSKKKLNNSAGGLTPLILNPSVQELNEDDPELDTMKNSDFIKTIENILVTEQKAEESLKNYLRKPGKSNKGPRPTTRKPSVHYTSNEEETLIRPSSGKDMSFMVDDEGKLVKYTIMSDNVTPTRFFSNYRNVKDEDQEQSIIRHTLGDYFKDSAKYSIIKDEDGSKQESKQHETLEDYVKGGSKYATEISEVTDDILGIGVSDTEEPISSSTDLHPDLLAEQREKFRATVEMPEFNVPTESEIKSHLKQLESDAERDVESEYQFETTTNVAATRKYSTELDLDITNETQERNQVDYEPPTTIFRNLTYVPLTVFDPLTSTTIRTNDGPMTTTTRLTSSTTQKSSTLQTLPPRASRVNPAIKTSIAGTPTRRMNAQSAPGLRSYQQQTSSVMKCIDAKCNEIPSRYI